MAAVFPTFRDRLLENVARQFEKRRKAINHKGGTLVVEANGGSDAVEHLVVRFEMLSPRPVLIVELSEKHFMSLFVLSGWSGKRGKVLVRLDAVRVLDRAAEIVSTFESTIASVWNFDQPDSHDEVVAQSVLDRWQELLIRSV